MAVNEINDSGGVFGQPIEAVFEAPSQGAAQNLLDQGANAIIGPTDAASAQEAATAASEPGVPVFAFVATPDAPAGVFNMTPSQKLQTAVLANLALEQDERVGCVLYESGAGDMMAAAFQAALEHKQGRVRKSMAFAAGDDLGEIVNNCISG
jgi:ABC-type branched-subunit amino acid transport system substrate-binding protein